MEKKYQLNLPESIKKDFNLEFINEKWNVLPEYVQHFDCNSEWDPNLVKITSRKWGRRAHNDKAFVETPGMIFFRAAYYAAYNAFVKDSSINREELTRKYFDLFSSGSIMPNTPYMSNAGHILMADYFKKNIPDIENKPSLLNEFEEQLLQKPQTSACFVLDMKDDLESIMGTLSYAALIQAHNGGTGFNFRLRPAQEPVRGSGGHTDGPVSFMRAYSEVLGRTINQGGKRKGANMFMLDVDNPDLFRFLYAKSNPEELSGANVSVFATEEFMKAYFSDNEEDSYYPAVNVHHNPSKGVIPKYYSEKQLRGVLKIAETDAEVPLSMKLADDGVTLLSPYLLEGMPEEFRKIGRVINGFVHFNAKSVMKHIAYLSYQTAEPGIIFSDKINDSNPTHPKYWVEAMKEENKEKVLPNDGNLEAIVNDAWYGRANYLPIGVGVIRSTNPCGEQPLLGNESCVLGHVNWANILVKDETQPSGYRIDFEKLKDMTYEICNILDDSIDTSDFLLPQIKETHHSNRKIGMGFMGLADLLLKLEIPYYSEEGRKVAEEIWKKQMEYSMEISHTRAEKFGAFPNFNYSKYRKGPVLRNATTTTVAPTGTTSTIAQTSGGIEPHFALKYSRTTSQGTKLELTNKILDEKLEKYGVITNEKERKSLSDIIHQTGSISNFSLIRGESEDDASFERRTKELERLKKVFVVSNDISAKDHIRMQAAIQKYTHNAVSKTINFRNSITVDDIEEAYVLAYNLGCVGCTFYRDGSRKDQPLQLKGNEKPMIVKTPNKALDDNAFMEEVKRRLELPRPQVIGTTVTEPTPHGSKVYVTTNVDVNTGRPYETFFSAGKSGSNLAAMAQALGRVFSVAMQSGAPLEALIKQIEKIGGEDRIGFGDGKVLSLPDAIAKGIKGSLIQLSMMEWKPQSEKENSNSSINISPVEVILNAPSKNNSGFNLCPECGASLIKTEGCEKCSNNCGFSRCG